MNITRLKYRISIFILLFLDISFIFLLLKTAQYIRTHILTHFFHLPQFNPNINYLWIIPFFVLVFAYEKLYTKTFTFWEEIKLIIKSSIISLIIILSLLFALKASATYSRTLIITHTVLMVLIFPIIRTTIRKLLYKFNLLTKKALIVGSGEIATDIYDSLTEDKNLCYYIAGFVDDTEKKKIKDKKIHKGIHKLPLYIKYAHITDLIIAKDNFSEREIELINKLQHKVENIIFVPNISGIAAYGTEIKYFFTKQLIGFEIKNNLSNPITYLTKRVIDYILGLIVFIFIIPLLIIISIIIKLTSEGPVIYSHKRIGKKAKEFNCYKFRTMYKDADQKLKEILEKYPEKKKEWETYWKLKDDPRITPIGKFLRKTSLDELPQIFNVLKGEMSLIGPRPYLPREWEYIKDESPIIHALPPGITGLWQVSGRSNTSYEYRVSLDSWYVKNWNLWLDIVILLKTIKAVIKREGAC